MGRLRRSTPGGRCWWPRRPARARRSSPSTPSPRRSRPAAGRSTPRRSRRCRTRSTATWSRVHGAEQVGLLTGDNAINGDAPVVVMTTEVLRNMIYAGSPALDGLDVVVLDEVHFLQDAYRGPVWEEVIIHLPARGPAGVPVGHGVERRGAGRLDLAPSAARPRRWSRSERPGRASRTSTWSATGPASGCTCCRRWSTAGPTPRRSRLDAEARTRRRAAGSGRGAGRRRLYTPRRVEVVERLDERADAAGDLLHLQPDACDEAAAAVPRRRPAAHHAATSATGSARSSTRASAASTTGDLAVLGYGRVPGRAGGGHRRPPRRHGAAVQGGGRGLLRRGPGEGGVRHRDAGPRASTCRPGRVVIEKLTQVHRRAPRVPHAGGVHPAHRPGRPARHRRASATPSCCGARSCPSTRWPRWPSSRSFHLHSAFRPTYNMAANLVRSYTSERGPPPPQPVVRPVPGRPRRGAARGPARAPPGSTCAELARAGRAARSATSTSTGALQRRRRRRDQPPGGDDGRSS